MNENVIVLGGSGFIGKNLQEVRPNWRYMSSKNYDLFSEEQVAKLFTYEAPIDKIINLAGIVDGIQANSQHQATFGWANAKICLNVMEWASMFKIRVLTSLSTCAFPDVVGHYPFVEEDFHNGPPAKTNIAYGMAKRFAHVMSCAYREQKNCDFSTFSPSNVYGPHDLSSHFVPDLVCLLSGAKDGDIITLYGDGTPLRQQLYAPDLAKIIPILVEEHHSDLPLIVAPNENLSIKEMAEIGREIADKDVKFEFDGKLQGQYRKDGSNKRLMEIIGNDFEFTLFKDGLRLTYEWYKEFTNA